MVLPLLGAGPGAAVIAPSASTWNPSSIPTGITLSVGNTRATNTSGTDQDLTVLGTSALSGKQYFEVVCTLCNVDSGFGLVLEMVGVANTGQSNTSRLGGTTNSGGARGDGAIIYNFIVQTTETCTFTTGSVMGIAMDTSTKKVWFTNNGTVWCGSSGADDPVTGTGGADLSTVPVTTPWFPAATVHTAGNSLTLRTGSGFSYSIPVGFTAAA